MEPQIQYATTSDGVNVAFWADGEGPPLVITPSIPFGIGHLLWQLPEARPWLERPKRYMSVSYDARGTGHSARADDLSLEGHVKDLEAVVDNLGLERFALLATLFMGPVAIEYTARHPEHVSKLILWHSFASGREVVETQRYQALASLRAMASQEWELYTNTIAAQGTASADSGLSQRLGELFRKSVQPADAVALMDAVRTFDATARLSAVSCPTLVLYRRAVPVSFYPPEAARTLVSGIPNARLLVLEGDSIHPFVGDWGAMARAVDDFAMGEEAPRGVAARPAAAPDVVTVLFTDLASSTALTQQLGDAQAQELLRAHNVIVREALASHGGSEIKHTGDGIMASFT
ncbi:MAG: alpha/beta fold hydrolase, partial [Dehalococcoidia bacterium]